MVDFGRLKSPLPDSELLLKMIRELRQAYSLGIQKGKAQVNRDFVEYLKDYNEELDYIADVSELVRVRIVRMQESLKSVEAELNNFRKNLNKNSKSNDNAKETLSIIDSLLSQIEKIKDKIRTESKRSIIEERRIRRNI